jgi:arsenite-transporting ATPase
MRVILYTGKGGVGKTTIAAATALRAAELGYRTIVLSTDAAHSLGDSFDIPLHDEPKLIASNLWAQETEMVSTMAHHWRDIQEWLTALMAWRGMEQIIAEEMALLPGMEELANLLYIVDYAYSGNYDIVIVDCAPTGETLRFLSFPDQLRWWMEKLFPIERKAASVLRPIVKPFIRVPFPEDKVFAAMQRLFEQLMKTRELLSDPDISSVRLVVNPEKMVIKEAQRTFTYLNLYGFATDLIVCNRLIPQSVSDRYFDTWKESQSKYFRMIQDGFSPVPILTAPLLDQEVVGMAMLKVMADALYGAEDPTKLFFRGQAQKIEAEDSYYVLILSLPFVSKSDVSLERAADELHIRVGDYRRNVVLPRSLALLPVKDAKFEEGRLQVRFEKK